MENGLRAVCQRVPVAWSSPVFRLRSKRGKLLDENIQTQTMSGQKHMARGPQVNGELVHLSWGEERGDACASCGSGRA